MIIYKNRRIKFRLDRLKKINVKDFFLFIRNNNAEDLNNDSFKNRV